MNIFKFIYNIILNIFRYNKKKKDCGEIVEVVRYIKSDGSTAIHFSLSNKK